jgi:hypothetical protein
MRQSHQRIMKPRNTNTASATRKKLAEESIIRGIDTYIEDLQENQRIAIKQAVKQSSTQSAR